MNKPNDDFVILDVRTPSEYAESHVKGSINIDFLAPDFESHITGLDKTKCYKIYCRSGMRAGKALERLSSLGFEDLENLGTADETASRLGLPCVK